MAKEIDIKEICNDLRQQMGPVGYSKDFTKCPGSDTENNQLDLLFTSIVFTYYEGCLDDKQRKALAKTVQKIGNICGIER